MAKIGPKIVWIRVISSYIFVESIIYSALSLTSILGYAGVFGDRVTEAPEVPDYIFQIFVKNTKEETAYSRIIDNQKFFAFSIIYLVSGLIWFILSVLLLWGTLKVKLNKNDGYKFYILSSFIIGTSIIDVILLGALLSDLTKFNDFASTLPSAFSSIQNDIQTAYITVIVVAAKGGLLWILNVVSGIFLIIFGKNINSYVSFVNQGSSSSVYDSSRPPENWLQPGTSNEGYQNHNNEEFSYDARYQRDNLSSRNYYINSNVDLDDYHVSPVHIPTPDYTPPSTPTPSLRPALKRKMKYSRY